MGHFIEFVWFAKNDSCAEMGLRLLKMVPSQLSWRIRIRRLENPCKRRFIKPGDFNKITEKLVFPGIFTHFGRFSNFCKSAYFWVKFNEKYASEIAMPVWPTILEIMPSCVLFHQFYCPTYRQAKLTFKDCSV